MLVSVGFLRSLPKTSIWHQQLIWEVKKPLVRKWESEMEK